MWRDLEKNRNEWKTQRRGHGHMTCSTCLSVCPLRAFLYRAGDHSSGQRSAANWQHTHTDARPTVIRVSLSHSTPRTFHYPQHSHKYHPPPLLHKHTHTHYNISTQQHRVPNEFHPSTQQHVFGGFYCTTNMWKNFITSTGPAVNAEVSCVMWVDLLT